MIRDTKPPLRRLVALAVIGVVFVVCVVIYGTLSNNYSEAQVPTSYSPILTNPEVLTNWLPTSAYHYTVSQIDNYLQSKDVKASSMTVVGGVNIDEASGGGFAFSLLVQPQNQKYNILVTLKNYSGIISAAVSVDGQQQSYVVPPQSSGGTTFSGFNGLVNDGLTAIQAEELQVAFQKFSPGASSVNINLNSVILPPINPSSSSTINTYAFVVNIDGTNYAAKLNSIGLNEIDLLLTNPKSGQQIFNSGTISQI